MTAPQPPQLGDRVTEIVTGHEGVVAGVCEYLWGCQQALVHYKDGEKWESTWWDIGRLVVIRTDTLKAIDYAASGADLAPPIR